MEELNVMEAAGDWDGGYLKGGRLLAYKPSGSVHVHRGPTSLM